MLNKSHTKLFNKVTKKLRKSQASILAIEEISELITEISELLHGASNFEDLCEEVADVRIMSELVRKTFHIKKSELSKMEDDLKEDFKKFVKSNSTSENLKACIYELANYQKVICKKSRGRHNKKDIITAMVSIELYIGYLEDKGFITEKSCVKWETMKIKRMQNRIRKNQIV